MVESVLIRYAEAHPDAFAADLALGSAEDVANVLQDFPDAVRVRVLLRLPQQAADTFLAAQSDATIAVWLTSAGVGDAQRLFARLRADRRDAVLAAVDDATRLRALERSTQYPITSVGAFADPDVAWVRERDPVSAASTALRAMPGAERHPVIVVNDTDEVAGMFDSTKALKLNPAAPVSESVINVPHLRAETTIATAMDASVWEDYPTLPVVDHASHLVGVVSRTRLLAAASNADTAAAPTRVNLIADLFLVLLGTAPKILEAAIGTSRTS